MKLLVNIASLEMAKQDQKADAFLLGIDGLTCNTYAMTKEMVKQIKEAYPTKEIFVALNKIMHNDDLKALKETMLYLDSLNLQGILFYDLAVLNLKQTLKLKTPLVWAMEHATTNYATCHYYEDKAKAVLISSDITLNEVKKIKANTKLALIVPMFGYLPIFNSERHLVNNYLAYYHLENHSPIRYMYKEGFSYPLIDDELGTTVYSSFILDGVKEAKKLQKWGIDYLYLNSFLIDPQQFVTVIDRFKELKTDKLDDLFSNLGKGFMYKETIYKVKK